MNQHENTLVMAIGGELDHHRAISLIEELRHKIDTFLPKILVIDLKDLSFSDSSGIGLLLRVHRCMQQIQGELTLVHVQSQPKRLFEMAGLGKFIQEEETYL